MVSCWFPMVSAWFPCIVIHKFHGFLVVSIWFPLVFTTYPKTPNIERSPSVIFSTLSTPGNRPAVNMLPAPIHTSAGILWGEGGAGQARSASRTPMLRAACPHTTEPSGNNSGLLAVVGQYAVADGLGCCLGGEKTVPVARNPWMNTL